MRKAGSRKEEHGANYSQLAFWTRSSSASGTKSFTRRREAFASGPATARPNSVLIFGYEYHDSGCLVGITLGIGIETNEARHQTNTFDAIVLLLCLEGLWPWVCRFCYIFGGVARIRNRPYKAGWEGNSSYNVQ